ncbi:MAG: Fic family protein [Longimicrobiales bacterium]
MPGKTIPQTWLHNPTLAASPKYRRACRYDSFVPTPLNKLNLELDSDLAGLISDTEFRILDLNNRSRPALQPLARLLLRTESIASSKVEGMQMDAKDLARAEARSESGMRIGALAAEIIANIDAMELAIEEASSVDLFGINEIRAIHERLMRNAPGMIAGGRVRTLQNWIGGNNYNPCGADFVPPPPEIVPSLLEDLCAAINDDILPPIVQAALVHAQFETIHPFDDGNGRTGRALIHVILRRRGLAISYVPPISVVIAGARDRYIKGLTTFRGERVEPWIDYFAASAGQAAHLAARYAEAVEKLVQSWRESLLSAGDPPRADAAVWSVIDMLPAFPSITGPVASAKSDRSRGRVYEALQILESAGVLVPLTSGKRNQAWEPRGLLDLIAGLESGVLPNTTA